ncbi:sterigmatocystin biosynthesis monooxygenase stcW [Fusarium subglutinans]|uniref:Sterigmatocystin biosynthesis monooxygenase stcW n=1 Tax=Gibberella subglutinans TaxID=42677 RepID=A0A8H5Q4Y8_GIBSU|nr:sterigmatocystin biosynthesis monooxygenase stcW [Fusarium subglutinans]KAF5608263.1 sterigmatocystin biosynthesis monooxygenase stcW [Fusarium subglutinans]
MQIPCSARCQSAKAAQTGPRPYANPSSRRGLSNSPFLIPGLKFFTDPESNSRPGNLFSEKLHSDYHNNPETRYHIPFAPIGDPGNRRLKVITIEAGLAGVILAYNIEKHCPNVEHVIYEKNPTVGGTWYQNRYPNAACDSPTCTYQFNFAIDPEWEKFLSGSDYLRQYVAKVVKKLDLEKYMTFNSRVIEARFDDKKGIWDVKIEQTASDESKKTFTGDCDLLLGAVGILDRWEYPKIPGLESFKGQVIHSADRTKWKQYTKDKWANDEIAVIGSGASAYQVVPGMQPYAKRVHSFLRTPAWFFAQMSSFGGDPRPQDYTSDRWCLEPDTEEEKSLFRKDHGAMLKHAKANESVLMMLQHMMVKHGPAYHQARKTLTERTRKWIKDDDLFEKLIPSWSPGCHRITPGDPFMVAIQEPNVDVHLTGVSRVDENGVFGDDGTYTACVLPNSLPLDRVGRLRPSQRVAYRPSELYGCLLEAIVGYTVKVIKKMQRDNIKYFVPRQDATDEFNDHAQSWFKGTVWEENCNAWYKNRKTGRVDAIWPGSALHFRDAIEDPRWEDMEIKYHSYLGYGFAPVDLSTSSEADRSPYLKLENLDPRFYE